MGLDMYMFAEPPKNQGQEQEEFFYWRKHNALHGWMEAKYRELNPEFEGDFNLINFYLTHEILDELETDIKNNNLHTTSGFFFGDTEYDPFDEADRDLQMIASARDLLNLGHRVFYTSWW